MKKQLLLAVKIYLFTWVLVLLLMFSLAFRSDIDIADVVETLTEVMTYTPFIISIHVLFVFIYLLFLLVRYFVNVYHRHGFKTMGKRLIFTVITPICIIFGIFKWIVYTNNNEDFEYHWDHTIENTTGFSKDRYQIDGKHRGMSVFGWGNTHKDFITPLVINNIEWVAVIPFMYQKDEHTVAMNAPDTIGKWSRRDSIFINTITQLHDQGVHVQLKPHLWTREGWRSNIKQQSDKDWNTWFDSYRKNMLHYAQLAEENCVELLCIGTELRSSLKQQPESWKSLVQEIKTIYHGKLTYAANWDGEYELIDFWDQLDYIGIQGYFPLTKTANPNLETIKKGWQPHIVKLETLSKSHKKPILFTEVGYKSETTATIRPWEWGSFFSALYRKKSDRTQQLAYQALFETIWQEEWFAGIYIWQWNNRSDPADAPNSLGFSPRFKPAQNAIAKGFGE